MLEKLLGLATGASLTDLGGLAAITAVVVQVLKQIVPKSFPTKALTIIVAIVVTLVITFLSAGITLASVGSGLLMGFVVAFVSMNGFDSLNEIWARFTLGQNCEEENDDVGGEG